MASLLGNQGSNATLTTSPNQVVFDATTEPGGACNAYKVANKGGVDILVRVSGLHDTENFEIAAGDVEYFDHGGTNQNGITKVTAHAVGSSSTISGGVVKRA